MKRSVFVAWVKTFTNFFDSPNETTPAVFGRNFLLGQLVLSSKKIVSST